MGVYIDGSRPAPTGVVVSAAWERAVAAPDGEAVLLVRVVAPADPPRGRRTPTDVAFVLDRSGSMAGEKIELVKRAVDVACGLLRDEDRAALVTFANGAEVVQALAPATPRTKTAIRLALPGIDAGGGTDLSGGWLTGCRELASGQGSAGAGARTRRAVLLTDGQANGGIVDPGELGREANELRRRGISTTTLGVGLGFDEVLLQAMAESGGGNFAFVERPEELRAFFERELQELLRTVAIGLTVTVTLPDGLHAHPVSAFPAQRSGRTWTVALGDVPAGEELELVFRLPVRGGRAGDELPVAVSAGWADPAADARRGGAVDLPSLTLGNAAAVERAIADDRVREAYAIQRAAAERRRALELDRQGRYEESRGALASAVFSLSAAPRSHRVAGYLEDTQALASFEGPYDETTRKRAAHENERRRKSRDRGPAAPSGSEADARSAKS